MRDQREAHQKHKREKEESERIVAQEHARIAAERKQREEQEARERELKELAQADLFDVLKRGVISAEEKRRREIESLLSKDIFTTLSGAKINISQFVTYALKQGGAENPEKYHAIYINEYLEGQLCKTSVTIGETHVYISIDDLLEFFKSDVREELKSRIPISMYFENGSKERTYRKDGWPYCRYVKITLDWSQMKPQEKSKEENKEQVAVEKISTVPVVLPSAPPSYEESTKKD